MPLDPGLNFLDPIALDFQVRIPCKLSHHKPIGGPQPAEDEGVIRFMVSKGVEWKEGNDECLAASAVNLSSRVWQS